MTNGFIIAAPQSGSGKTTITLGLLRALTRSGQPVRSAKAGPDFIDPAFHAAATGADCVNLDPWAMRSDLIEALATTADCPLVIEAMMGLFDGGADGKGSAADLAVLLRLPVVLVVDAAKQSHSIAALVAGFRDYRRDITVAGVILNRVGSARHALMLREALDSIDMPVLGCVARNDDLRLPSRHLGLVQAREHDGLEDFLNAAADLMGDQIDIDALMQLSSVGPACVEGRNASSPIAPPGQRIALASDDSFAFIYPHLLQGWRRQGAEIVAFSPLADEAPDPAADAVYLPGGYPELFAGRLAGNQVFKKGMHRAAASGSFIYGECGGYMVLGEGLVDADGTHHAMLGLLPLVTSFEKRRLNLGYRLATPKGSLPFVADGLVLTAHEFHYSTIVKQEGEDALFSVQDARGESLGDCGLRQGNVAGSYLHLIDRR